MHILVAEDDRDIAELVAHYLKKAGWSAHVASAGDQALAYIRNHPVDVVVLDLMLPGMSGLDVCQALRADRATAGVPVIMLTARAEEADRVKGLELGADDYVVKPFSPNELVARIRALVRRLRRPELTDTVLRLGPIVVDLSRHTRGRRRARCQADREGVHAAPVPSRRAKDNSPSSNATARRCRRTCSTRRFPPGTRRLRTCASHCR
ncbi:MAG: response regulator transcription factor [Acidobacteria bacterium]|nr:response regulator transcription factor [Acidobacteriota bacterium]